MTQNHYFYHLMTIIGVLSVFSIGLFLMSIIVYFITGFSFVVSIFVSLGLFVILGYLLYRKIVSELSAMKYDNIETDGLTDDIQ